MACEQLIEAIDRVLPQTQCTRCGYPDCRAYACALAGGTAPINRCPPGGEAGIRRLAAITGQPYSPLDATCGVEHPRRVAVVDEARCIGCTLCIQACPVDAIIGAPRAMHVVISELCTGCELCVAPCPVDCIAMVEATGAEVSWDERRADRARERYEFRRARLVRDAAERAARLASRAPKSDRLTATSAPEAKRAAIQAAFERARAKRAAYAARDRGTQ